MATKACAYCNKINTDKPLEPCNNCKAVAYCDRTCQQAHFKAHKKTCREQKIAEDYAVKDQAAIERAVKDDHAEQLAAEFLESEPTEAEKHPRVLCYADKDGAAVMRTLDNEQQVQPRYTYVLWYIQPAGRGGRTECQFRAFSPAMVAAMEHMTEAEKAAYHSRVHEAMFKEWEELEKDPEVPTELDQEERKRVEQLAREVKAEQSTRCLNERA
ncbi:hypothetical protein MBLNU13_g10859t1 [Cladosporium sp. NU13]